VRELNENAEYALNYFRKLHREKVSQLGTRCSFLLCESGTNIDDLRPSLPSGSQEKPQWDDAEHREFTEYTTRFETLDSWPQGAKAQNSFVTPAIMAKHGFYFSGLINCFDSVGKSCFILGPNDGVTCFYCGNILTDWLEAMCSTNKNIVQLEHARFFPCRFIEYTAGGKFVANAGFFHVVSDQGK
jgi:hypothetical protein